MSNTQQTINQAAIKIGVPVHRLSAHMRSKSIIDCRGNPTEHSVRNGLVWQKKINIQHANRRYQKSILFITEKGLRSLARDFDVQLRAVS